MIGKNTLGHIRGQDGVADVGVPDTDFLNRQVVGQMTGADDLNAVVENKEPDVGSRGQ